MRHFLEAEMYFKADQESFQIPIVIAHEFHAFHELVSSDFSITSHNRLMNTSDTFIFPAGFRVHFCRR